MNIQKNLVALIALTSSASAMSLALDFQPTGGTTAAGHEAFEFANQSSPASASSDYTAFGSTITITVSGTNIRVPTDWRAVTRDGLLSDVANDWLGVDARDGGDGGNLLISVSGLPAGAYTFTSLQHDGGDSVGNGNIVGDAAYSFTDANGTTNGATAITDGNTVVDVNNRAEFTTAFVSDGTNPVSYELSSSGVAADAIFAFTSGVTITAVPEPSSALLGLVGALSLLRRRR